MLVDLASLSRNLAAKHLANTSRSQADYTTTRTTPCLKQSREELVEGDCSEDEIRDSRSPSSVESSALGAAAPARRIYGRLLGRPILLKLAGRVLLGEP